MVLEGRVEMRAVNRGSKSDHDAAVLVTVDGPYTLRRRGGHPFSDPAIEALVGQRIRGEGVVSAGQFIMSSWDVLD